MIPPIDPVALVNYKPNRKAQRYTRKCLKCKKRFTSESDRLCASCNRANKKISNLAGEL